MYIFLNLTVVIASGLNTYAYIIYQMICFNMHSFLNVSYTSIMLPEFASTYSNVYLEPYYIKSQLFA